MTMTDPIADMLTRIRNANAALKTEVVMPSSKLKVALANVLLSEGYITGFEVLSENNFKDNVLKIEIKYSKNRQRTISGIKRISKPGLRIYASADKLPRVLGGLGSAILSTSQGLMTDKQARQKHVGGEVICHVW
jgi:small subunit ribosomal protein S8